MQRLFCVDCTLSVTAYAVPPPTKGGGFALLTGRCQKAPPSGELAPQVTERVSLHPPGEGGCERSEQTEGVPRQSLQQAVYRLIYQFAAFRGTDISTGQNTHVFCAIDISVQIGQFLDGGEREWEKKRAAGDGRAQRITGRTVNRAGIIENSDVMPMLHPRFLCKSLKYTSCTVFQRKFIHFGKDVELHTKTRAIFVRFYPVSL